ncbi:unnamed protein product, partial [Penicillium discolor]
HGRADARRPRRWEDGGVTAIEPNVVPFASPAAAGGDPYVTTPVAYDAILLASFGGPEGQEDVIPFLRNIRPFYDHPGFVEAFEAGVRESVQGYLDQGFAPTEIQVLFSTHSIPTADAERSGARDIDWGEGGAYAAQHLAVSEWTMEQVRAAVPGAADVPWELVYQSRSGPASQPWLEPDVCDVIAELPARGRKAVIVVPVGFMSDHMEVLWDLDTEAAEAAEEAGLAFVRTPTPGVREAFVEGIVDLIEERLQGRPNAERPHVTDLPGAFDVCRPGCCENVRAGFKPAAAGIAP